MTQDEFRKLVVTTFVISRGKLEHQKKIIDYLLTYYTLADFNGINYPQAFDEVIAKFNQLRASDNHAPVASDPGGTVGDAIRHFENNANKEIENPEQARESLMLDLLMGMLERDAYYLSNSNEEARESARKSDFRDKILNPQLKSISPVDSMWNDLHSYFQKIVNGEITLSLKQKKELFEAIDKVVKRWPNYYAETPFFENAKLGDELKRLANESSAEYFGELQKPQ